VRLVPREGRSQPTIDLSEYVDGLYSYALVLSRDRTEAEDLVQETCLRAIRAMGSLRPDSNAKGWLVTILRNIWFNQLRQWRTAREVVELDLQVDGANRAADSRKDPHATYVSNIEQEQVRTAIQQLPVEFREVIILREYEDLSYQEIAAVLECPLGTVMSRLARARSKLRDLLSVESLTPRSVKKVTSGYEETGTCQWRPQRASRARKCCWKGLRDSAEPANTFVIHPILRSTVDCCDKRRRATMSGYRNASS
jgi:RNA polymerase sigma-70 factor, ECF subfamily